MILSIYRIIIFFAYYFFKNFLLRWLLLKIDAFDLNHFTNFEQVKTDNGHFADFEQIKFFSSHFADFEQVKRFSSYFTDFECVKIVNGHFTASEQ